MVRYQFNFSVVWESLPFFAEGVGVTVMVAVSAMLLGFIWGMAICLCHLSRLRWLSMVAQAYITFFRGTPLIMQLFWVHYSLPIVAGIALPPFLSGVTALALNLGAFISEALRAGIQSVSKGQWEAAFSLGMDATQVMRRIVFPQAFRTVVPPLGNLWVSLFKDSSIVSLVGVADLMNQGKKVSVLSYRPVEVFTFLALTYFVLTYPQARLVDKFYKMHRVAH